MVERKEKGTKHLAWCHPTKKGKVNIDAKWEHVRPSGWPLTSVLAQAGRTKEEFEVLYWERRLARPRLRRVQRPGKESGLRERHRGSYWMCVSPAEARRVRHYSRGGGGSADRLCGERRLSLGHDRPRSRQPHWPDAGTGDP